MTDFEKRVWDIMTSEDADHVKIEKRLETVLDDETTGTFDTSNAVEGKSA